MKLSECKRCSLHKKRLNVVLPIIRGTAPSVFFLGEAPGHGEDIHGQPFWDDGPNTAGYWHWKIARAIGVENSCIVMNTIQCRPVIIKDGQKRNGKPKSIQMDKCFVWLEQMLEKYRFRLMILYGTYPIVHILNFGSPIKSYVGKFFEAESLNRIKCFATYHPASICYNKKEKLPIFKRHIKIIRKYLYQ